MSKNLLFTIFIAFYVSAPVFSSEPAETSVANETPKSLAEKASKKYQDELSAVRKKFGPALSTIEPIVSRVISSSEFKATIEKMTTQQAADIAAGKSFEEVKYDHSLSNEFPKMTNPNKFLALVYSILANIAHYQLLSEKLNTVELPTSSTPQNMRDSSESTVTSDQESTESSIILE